MLENCLKFLNSFLLSSWMANENGLGFKNKRHTFYYNIFITNRKIGFFHRRHRRRRCRFCEIISSAPTKMIFFISHFPTLYTLSLYRHIWLHAWNTHMCDIFWNKKLLYHHHHHHTDCFASTYLPACVILNTPMYIYLAA